MEGDILDYLEDIGFSGYFPNQEKFHQSVAAGVKDEQFRKLVVTLCQQLKQLLNLDETVEDVSEHEDTSGFIMEISSLMKEINCPYKNLVEGPVTDRLGNVEKRLQLLYFLVTEIMAARLFEMEKVKNSQKTIQESDPAKDLKSILIVLKFPRPPDNITSQDIFSKIEAKLNDLKKSVSPALFGKPMLKGLLSLKQVEMLNEVYIELLQEYKLRREMLLKRLDVTIQSFEWSDSAKGKNNAIAEQFIEKRQLLLAEPRVQLSDVIAAREDLAVIEKTSNWTARKNTQSSVNKVIIGRVPDRGGRPSEQAAPPPEMPSWQKDRAQGGGGNRGGGQFSRGGGRVQGGWNQHDERTDSQQKNDHYDNGRGGSRGGGRGRGNRGRNY